MNIVGLRFLHHATQWLRRWLSQASRKGASYWIQVIVLVGLGTWLGNWVGGRGQWIEVRYRLYQRLSELGARSIEPRHTAIVVIGDEEYWRGPLAGRRPLKRDYLAKLIEALDDADAAVIALDFDFRSPTPQDPRGHEEYARETRRLFEAVMRIAARRAVVLPKTLGQDNAGKYRVEADIYDPWSLCPLGSRPPTHLRMYCGYIALPRDMRLLPPRLALNDGRFINSFALAIVEAVRGPVSEDNAPLTLRYGNYIPVAKFQERRLVFLASDVLGSAETRRRLAHRTVIVGGVWSRLAYGRGAAIDVYQTPVGALAGVFIHANYAEALLDGRVYPPMPDWAVTILGDLFVIAAAVSFVGEASLWRKFWVVLRLCILLIILSYILLQNLGRFFDGFIPLIFVVGHAVFHQVLQWRAKARRASDS